VCGGAGVPVHVLVCVHVCENRSNTQEENVEFCITIFCNNYQEQRLIRWERGFMYNDW